MRTLNFVYWLLVSLILSVTALMYFTADNVMAQGMYLAICISTGVPLILVISLVYLVIRWIIRR